MTQTIKLLSNLFVISFFGWIIVFKRQNILTAAKALESVLRMLKLNEQMFLVAPALIAGLSQLSALWSLTNRKVQAQTFL